MKWTVGTKIGAGFALALISVAVIGMTSYFSTKRLVETADWVTHTHVVLENLEGVLFGLKDAQSAARGYLVTGGEGFKTTYTWAKETASRKVRHVAELTVDNPVQQETLGDLSPLIFGRDGYFQQIEQTMDLRAKNGFDPAAILENGKNLQEIQKLIGSLQAEEFRLLRLRVDAARRSVTVTDRTIAGVTIASFLLLVGAAWLLTRNIAEPLREVSELAERIAAGDLAVGLAPHARRDEVGVLQQSFSRMTESLQRMAAVAGKIAAGDLSVEVRPQSGKDVLGVAFFTMTGNLKTVMRQILEAVTVVATSSGELMSTAAQLASGASETAAAVAETTATVVEMKQTTLIASEKGRALSENARNSAEISQRGRKSVEESIQGMNRIDRQMQSVAESIVRLSEQSRAIAEIIATVDDLAQQSNLLAVNASIEAAKAGEHGKGFAVVAQEVKTLAEQSKEGTTQVRGILNDIRKATSGAVMATEKGGDAVAAGVRRSEAAGEAIGLLAASVSAAADAAVQIAATSKQQSAGMDQVAAAMENIKQVSNQMAASTTEAQTAARDLNDLGQKLKLLVERFKLQ